LNIACPFTSPRPSADSLSAWCSTALPADSAIFIEFSSAKGKPEDYFKRSKAATVRARGDYQTLMGYLKMK
jgi:hypothetical protein